MTVAIYLRTSTDKQASANDVDSQRFALKLLFVAKGWDYALAREYTDSAVSGGKVSREHYDVLKADIAAGTITHLCCYDMSRLSRDFEDRVALVRLCMDKGVPITEYSGTIDTTSPEGIMVERFKAITDEYFRAINRRRTSMGIKAQIARGVKWAGAKTYAPGRRGCASLTDAQKAQLSALALKGLGATAIAREMGITPRVAWRWRKILLGGAVSKPNDTVNAAGPAA